MIKYPYSLIFKISLLASPLIGLSIFLPIYFLTSLSDKVMFIGLAIMIGAVFILWQLNLLILRLTRKYDNSYLRFIISFLVALVVIKLIRMQFHLHPSELPQRHDLLPRGLLPMVVGEICNFMVLFIIELVLVKTRERLVQDENNKLIIKNLEAQQQQLKQQIQPHFLFNSLNTLKSLINNHPNEAEEYLVKLSSLLRYNLGEHANDMILLHEELRICSDYLEMQKVRFKDALRYSITTKYDHKQDLFVPVFAIQLLVENAIKHNVLTAQMPLKIEIIIESDKVIVINNLQEKLNRESYSLQIGLKNLSERYKLLKKRDIEINKTVNAFEVFLPL